MQYSTMMIGELCCFGNPSDLDATIGSAEQLVKILGVFRGVYNTLSDDKAIACNFAFEKEPKDGGGSPFLLQHVVHVRWVSWLTNKIDVEQSSPW